MVLDVSLKPCPFCGCTPVFDGGGDHWMDDSRYVQMSLKCCVEMIETIWWMKAREMTPARRESQLVSRLTERWNTRVEPSEDKNSSGEYLYG